MEQEPKKKNRVARIGGQAVMEGVMMRGKSMYAMAVRKPNQQIEVIKKFFRPPGDKYPILKWPILRGVVSFVDSLVTGMRLITDSADLAGLSEDDPNEEPSRFEAFLAKLFGEKLSDAYIYFSVAIAIVLSVGLFMMLPVWIGSFFKGFLQGNTWALGFVEGIVRIAIFLAYVYLVSLSKDIRRVYEYHGAEHKTINCYESGDALCVANVKKHTRIHKRCGTSFLLLVMIISMLVFIVVRTDVVWLRLVSRVILIPVIAGLSYEVIRWAGNSDHWFVRAISFPGMQLQRITTQEPDDAQIETAIAALEGVLESEPDEHR